MQQLMFWLDRALGRTLLLMIRAYQMILSPWLGRDCRFHPTCSEYGAEAILLRGGVVGAWLTVKRIIRCHPWHAGGYDPVPTTDTSDDELPRP